MTRIAVIGGGSWGTALSIALSRTRAQHHISLWMREADIVQSIAATRINEIYLPGFELPRDITVTHDIGAALAGAEIVAGVMPSEHARSVYSAMLPHLRPGVAIVSATKGLERGTCLRMSEVISEVASKKLAIRVAAISGPSFAREVARGDPTAVVVASRDAELAQQVQEAFSGPTFRLYTNDDIVGVEICGAVKNVIAIAAGVCHGLGLGTNTVASLITRGLAEISRLATAMGGRPSTMAGLAGMGDLALTCTGALSRNRSVGVELGKGRKLADILSGMRMVAEGVGTTAVTRELARRHGVEMPITEQMHAVLNEGRAPKDAIRELMERRLKQE